MGFSLGARFIYQFAKYITVNFIYIIGLTVFLFKLKCYKTLYILFVEKEGEPCHERNHHIEQHYQRCPSS